jgi:hypothetical protein
MKFSNEKWAPPISECLQKYPNDQAKCLAAEYLLEYIKAI